MIGPARVAAFRVLREVARGEAQPAAVLAHEHRALHDPRDRALATEIVTGTLRWQRALDAAIAGAAARPLASIDEGVLVILRLTCISSCTSIRVPASAVVDDAVSLTRMRPVRRAPPASSTASCARSRAREATSDCRPGQPPGTAAGLDRLSRDRAVASRLAGDALARSLRLRERRGVDGVQQRQRRR
jgi:16S rRNA (cytosine967-C5)-methyltransferase